MAGECILVTGASSEIGLALCRRLLGAADSTHVLAHYNRNGAALDMLKEEFAGKVTPLRADFSDPAAVASMMDSIAAASRIPSSIVHLPALKLQYQRFAKIKWGDFQEDMSIQLQAAILLLQRFLPSMAKMKRAKVVFVLSSVVHGMPPRFMCSYTVLKYAQLGLMRALASEYASTPVTLNSISPGMVETKFLSDIPELAVEMSAANHPRGRNAVPGDLVGAIEFLLSPASDYMTGVDIPISGGSVC